MKQFHILFSAVLLILLCAQRGPLVQPVNAFVASGENFKIAPCQKRSPFTAHYNVRPSAGLPSSQSSYLNLVPTMLLDTVTVQHSIVALGPSLFVSETEPWVKPLSQVLGPFLNLFSFAMLCRVVISWYPKSNLNEFPYNLVVWPTEPLLRAIRGTVPPAFGVDITPIVWLAAFTFFNEILLGQQGLLTMKIKYGI